MRKIYTVFLLCFFSLSISGQSNTTILEQLKNGEVLRLEWVHQQYLLENGSKPSNFPLYPDQMTEGEGEVFVGLKFEMERCATKPCKISVWIEYVHSVQFPERQNVIPSLDLMKPTTPAAAKHFPKIVDTRYRFKNDKPNSLTDNAFTKTPFIIDVKEGLDALAWENFNFKSEDLPPTFSFYFLQQFLANLWQQNWLEKSHYQVVYQQAQFDK